MRYESVDELPKTLREDLPLGAQQVYLNAYNRAWDIHRAPDATQNDGSRVQVARKAAWTAVKALYRKDIRTGQWIEKPESTTIS